MVASFYGHAEAVDVLLKSKSDVNASDDNGETALIKASARGHGTIDSRLIRNGATIDAGQDAASPP